MWEKDLQASLKTQAREKTNMATALDLGLLNVIDFVFPFILVWAIVFALLQKTKIIGESVGINAVIAAAVGFTVLLSRTIIDIINFMIPWFAIAIIFFILMLLIFMIFGAKDKDIFSALEKNKVVTWLLIGVSVIIFFAAISNVMGQSLLEQSAGGESAGVVAGDGGVASGNFQQNILATLFHPKVLGVIMLFVIAIFAVALLTG